MIKKIITAGVALGTIFANFMVLPNIASAQSGCTGNSDPVAPPSASVGFFGGPLFIGAHEDFSASGNMGKGAPPQGWNPGAFGGGGAVQSGSLTVVSNNPGVVAIGGPGSYNALPGTTNIFANVPVAARSAGTAVVTVSYSGSDYFAGWNVDCNVSQSFTVTVQNNNGISVPIWTKTGTLMSSGGQRTPPAGYVTCGLNFTGLDNKGNNKATNVLFCPITASATAMGFSVAGPTYGVDMSNTHSYPQPMMCSSGWSGFLQLFFGVKQGGSSNQLDQSWCGTVNSNGANAISVDPSNAPGAFYTGQGFIYCPSTDQIPTGVATAPNKNDSWDRVYCGPVRFASVAPPPPVITGTLKVTSQSAGMGSAPVSATWTLNGPSGNVCSLLGAACYGSSQTYTGVDASNQIYNLSNPSTTVPGYTLKEVKHVFAGRSGFIDSLFALGKDLLAPVAQAVTISANGAPGATLTLTPSGSTNAGTFIILWTPGAALGVTPAATLTATTTNTNITVTNTGAPASVLNWSSQPPVYSAGASGWLSPLSPANGTITNGGSGTNSQSVSLTANITGIATGTYTATVPFTGTDPNNPGTLFNQTLTVTLLIGTSGGGGGGGGSPVSIVSVSPSSTVNVGVPVTTTCSGGSGAYSWSASSPNVTPPSGSGSTYTFSSVWPGTYTITCSDANNPGNTASVPETIKQITPVCTFSAAPSQITLPGSSILNWSCTGASTCNINGTSVNPVSGNMSVSPVTNTTYTLSCQSVGSGPGSTAQLQTTVRVVGPGIIEGNP